MRYWPFRPLVVRLRIIIFFYDGEKINWNDWIPDFWDVLDSRRRKSDVDNIGVCVSVAGYVTDVWIQNSMNQTVPNAWDKSPKPWEKQAQPLGEMVPSTGNNTFGIGPIWHPWTSAIQLSLTVVSSQYQNALFGDSKCICISHISYHLSRRNVLITRPLK